MKTSEILWRSLRALVALGALGGAALGADPGLAYPATSEISDQKAGSILIYNAYTSTIGSANNADSRLSLTNTSTTSAAFVHLFFVDGSTCSVADNFICLTQNQTASFLASDLDPGVTGYAVAVAVDGVFGCPINFNFLIGSVRVRFASGYAGTLGAEAIAAIAATPAVCDANTVSAVLLFDGVNYNRVPRVLALDSFGAAADGNTTLLVINRIGGNLATTAGSIGTIFGTLYDDAENVYSFTLPFAICQSRVTVDADNPRTVPRPGQVVAAGQTGWLKFWSTSEIGLLGAAFELNANAGNPLHPGGFSGGHNLHKLRLTTDAYIMPVLAPTC